MVKLGTKTRANLRLLITLLSAPGSESIIIANCDEVELWNEIQSLLQKELREKRIHLYHLDVTVLPAEEPLKLVTVLQQIVNGDTFFRLKNWAKNIVISIYGAENLNKKKTKEFISYLNFMRDDFAKIKYPVMIWVNTQLADQIAQNAPDFWSWRSAFFEFKTPKVEIGVPEKIEQDWIKKELPADSLFDLLRRNTGFSLPFFSRDWELQFYTPRPDAPLAGLIKQLKSGRENDKFLFTGPQGSGKTTELLQLKNRLAEDYFINHYPIEYIAEFFFYVISPVEIVLSMIVSLYEQIKSDEVPLEGEFVENIMRLFTKMTTAANADVDVDRLNSSRLPRHFLDLWYEMKFSDSYEAEFLDYVQANLTALIDILNRMISRVKKATGKKVLIIVETPGDFLMQGALEDLFKDHAHILLQPQCNIIYTIPWQWWFLPGMRQQLQGNFAGGIHFLPTIEVRDRKGKKSRQGINFLKKMILERIPRRFISDTALDKAAYMSGGSISFCLLIIHYAGLEASSKEKKKIDIRDVDTAVRHIYNSLSRTLIKYDYELFQRVRRDKHIGSEPPNERVLEHLVAQNIIVHENGELWYDVPPLIEELMQSRGI
ncbi:MAG: ATP-binding protein [Candidatus Aminicenantes bacterium]|nr:ATP-binding protein [Candidatus Aminicenantes bacterium]